MDPTIIGLMCAFSTGLLFGLHDVSVRLSRLRSAGSGVLLSLAAGYPIILLLALLLGGFQLLSLKALMFYVLAGVINFSVGRASMYIAISRLGASVASILMSTSVVYNLALGLLLGEDVGLARVTGSILVLLAVILTVRGGGEIRGFDLAGLTAGLLAGFSVALSILLGRLGNIESGNPIAGVLVAYTSGLVAEVILVGFREGLGAGGLRSSTSYPIVLAGVLASLGQAARYVALMYVGVSVVTPLQNTRPIVATLVSSLLSERTGERLNPSLALSAVLALIGSSLVVA